MVDLTRLRAAHRAGEAAAQAYRESETAANWRAVLEATGALVKAAGDVVAQADAKPAVPLLPCPVCGGEAIEDQDALARTTINAQPALAGVPEGWVMVRRDVVNFLSGAAPLDGLWFGEAPPSGGHYWWRKHLDGSAAPAAPASEGVEKLREFAQWAIRHAWGGLDIDGGDAQDMAEKLGLIEQYEVFESCGEECACAEGDFPAQCYRFAPILAAAKPGEVARDS